MAIGFLRPVGERLPVGVRPGAPYAWPDGYRVAWLNSGTAALALAVKAAVVKSGVTPATVIVPGYTCPDVASAVHWAGAVPRVVDSIADTPWLDASALPDHIDDSTVAVIAPHFLGIRHPMQDLGRICMEHGVTLIEDSAQLGPVSPAFRPQADLVVMSFGRGKPVPVGGGALLYRGDWLPTINKLLESAPPVSGSSWQWRFRLLFQNAAMSRIGYATVRRMPFLKVGETRYVPLGHVFQQSADHSMMGDAIFAGWRPGSGIVQARLREIIAASPDVTDAADALGWDGTSPLLRYPLLAATRSDRDRLQASITAKHIEASMFYGAALDELPAIPNLHVPAPLRSAAWFAARLLTIPAHSDVTERDIDLLGAALAPITH